MKSLYSQELWQWRWKQGCIFFNRKKNNTTKIYELLIIHAINFNRENVFELRLNDGFSDTQKQCNIVKSGKYLHGLIPSSTITLSEIISNRSLLLFLAK